MLEELSFSGCRQLSHPFSPELVGCVHVHKNDQDMGNDDEKQGKTKPFNKSRAQAVLRGRSPGMTGTSSTAEEFQDYKER